jgi:hypothetical protein
MTPRKLGLHIATFPYGGNGAAAKEHPDIRHWFTETVLWAKAEKRIDNISSSDINDCPITMSRNRAVVEARKAGAQVLVMIDSDQSPAKHQNDVGFKPFVPSSFDFLYDHYDKGPVVIGAPYCGPPPYENVYVFRWDSMGVYGDETSFGIHAYSRHEAAMMTGIVECAALPTGLIMYDMRAFELIEPCFINKEEILKKFKNGEIDLRQCARWMNEGWFYYEWKDGYASQKASTEDVTNTRDISLAGSAKLGYNPVFCNWDSWVGHWKPWNVGKPQRYGNEQIASSFKRAVLNDDCLGNRIVNVNVMHDLGLTDDMVELAPKNGHVTKIYHHSTPQVHLDALKKVVKSEWDRTIGANGSDQHTLDVCEIGTWHGDSAKAMAATGLCTVMCVDHWRGSDVLIETAKAEPPLYKFLENCKDEIAAHKINYRTGTSVEMAQQFTLDGRMFDIVFIDADHSYESVRDDITAWLPLVRDGGILIGHDWGSEQFPGVAQAVTEIFGSKAKPFAFSMSHSGFWIYRKEPIYADVR